MTVTQPYESEDREAYGKRMYELGRYNAYLEMNVRLAQGLAEIPHPQNKPIWSEIQEASDPEVLNLPIESLGIENPAPRILKREGIATIGKLIEYSRWDLQQFRGMGVCTASQIETSLRRYNLTLRKV